MITMTTYKDRAAVTLETKQLQMTVLPEDGAKIASLIRKKTGQELLITKPGDAYRVLAYDGSYVDSECSGFDDMFPTVDPCTPEDIYPEYPDHGECCRLQHTLSIQDDAVTLTAQSRVFPITYEKKLSTAEDGGFRLDYRITNHGTRPFPFLWAGHIMLQGEDGMRVLTSFDEGTATEMMFGPQNAEPSSLPRDRLCGYQPGIGATYKFYYLEKMKEGSLEVSRRTATVHPTLVSMKRWCETGSRTAASFGVSYPDGSRLLFEVDAEKLPYLGVWLNNGEFQSLYNIALEPCTIPFDAPDRAAARGYTGAIAAGAVFAFTMHICFDDSK